MANFNTIILKKGSARLTAREYGKFQKGDMIFGENCDPEELKRWVLDDEKDAEKELAKYHCSYRRVFNDYEIEEYALEYCECDECGEFIQGSDYTLADEGLEE